ncbi:peptidase S8/S53 domain-containing protein [Kockovaella imperatae]|uniref:tripeptidyl-peptidase II n=1 Tax=Kockovaella imperatae TaxID=4999 RepID=A0A1Y1UDW9_9TREE|nr:peptidase S8/S53 domain-containing protein [Kockovaella imperatae]ORX35275.1 peptidase S8/S53 domain-containing protein [Kockovaella imperatae]
MRTFTAYLLAALAVSAAPAPAGSRLPSIESLEARFGPYELHSRAPEEAHKGLQKRSLEDRDRVSEFSFKLHAQDQAAVDNLIATLSDPTHAQFRQWLSVDDAHEMTKSDPNGVEEILDYLDMHGISRSEVNLAHGNRTMSFYTNIEMANSIFGADYATYTLGNSHRKRATSRVMLPRSLHQYVARAEPGVDIRPGANRRPRSGLVKLSEEEHQRTRELHARMLTDYEGRDATLQGRGMTNIKGSRPIAVQGQPTTPGLTSALNNCWEYYFPVCVRAQYHLPSTTSPTSGTSIGSLNLKPNCAVASDLTQGWKLFFPNVYDSNPNYVPPHYDITVQGADTVACNSSDSGEPDLDLQTIVPLVYPMQVYDFSGPDTDTLNSCYGSVQQMGSGGIPKPDILSFSYGQSESQADVSTWQSYCQQTDAIILTGTTLLASTGDYGDEDMNYPALCPHWVAVGATDLNDDTSVTAPSWAEQETDGWQFSGGGGFSYNGQAAPSWQVAPLAAYAQKYTDKAYGKLQKNAATPDVSAMGRNYPIVTGGNGQLFGGTSLSCPMFSSILAMVNANMVAANKPLVGFPLPTFYANTHLFRDVYKGNNNEMDPNSTTAWPATPGWDPATGLGTPLFDQILQYYENNAHPYYTTLPN